MASSLWLELFILSALVMLIVSSKTTSQQKCPNTSTFTPNSAFSKNRNATLSSLLSNATLANGFYNTSSGALQGPDTANGLFLCRGDVPPSSCQACVKANSEKIITLCPIQKEAIIWDEECMLRYSNRSTFAKMESEPTDYVGNPNDAANPSQLNETLGDLTGSYVNQAVGSSNFFATDDVNFTTSNRLYGLAQCTPDIASSDCRLCLANCVSEIPKCCNGKEGGRVYKPSCNIRFEFFRFYNEASQPLPSPPTNATPPQATVKTFGGNRKISSKTIITITVPAALVFIIILSASCYYHRKGKMYKVANMGNGGNEFSLVESLQLDLHSIIAATCNFSEGNKIGEGGFGTVYKGTLHDGQMVAIKRLSESSLQGLKEFRNEVAVVAKLQHRNLVRLLGFSAEEEEKILVYEFVPNKSLDYFLFV